MNLEKLLKNYRPDLETPVADLAGHEMLKQYLYLHSGRANARGPRGRDLGLPEDLQRRLNTLNAIINHVLANRHFVPGTPTI